MLLTRRRFLGPKNFTLIGTGFKGRLRQPGSNPDKQIVVPSVIFIIFVQLWPERFPKYFYTYEEVGHGWVVQVRNELENHLRRGLMFNVYKVSYMCNRFLDE